MNLPIGKGNMEPHSFGKAKQTLVLQNGEEQIEAVLGVSSFFLKRTIRFAKRRQVAAICQMWMMLFQQCLGVVER